MMAYFPLNCMSLLPLALWDCMGGLCSGFTHALLRGECMACFSRNRIPVCPCSALHHGMGWGWHGLWSAWCEGRLGGRAWLPVMRRLSPYVLLHSLLFDLWEWHALSAAVGLVGSGL